jgi:competence protein ComEC
MQFFIAFLSGVVFFYAFQYFPFSTVAVSLSASGYLAIRKRFFILIVLISGAAYAFMRYDPPQDMPYIKDTVMVKGEFTSCPAKTEGGSLKQRFFVRSVEAVFSEGHYNAIPLHVLEGKEIVLLSDDEFDIGRGYKLDITLLKSGKRLNPGEFAIDDVYAKLKEVRQTGDRKKTLHLIIEESRYRINTYIQEHFQKESAAFLSSVTIGQGMTSNDKLMDAFNVTGLTHILSISGTHFGLLSVLLFGMFRLIIKVLPYGILQRMTIYLTPSQAAAILCLPFTVIYLGLSGASIPAVRSFLMIGLFLAGLLIGRKGFWLNSLLFAAFVIAVWEPEAIFSLSFQLSFLAVFCIGLAIDKEKEDDNKSKKLLRSVRNALLMTLAAALGTAPLVGYHFHYVSFISPISNLLVAPLIGFILIPLSVISAFSYLLTGYFIFTPLIAVLSEGSIYLVKMLALIPFADMKIPSFPAIILLLFYAGFIFYLLFRKKRLLLMVPFIPLVIYMFSVLSEKDKLIVTYLDVGQGDASVIELPDGRTMLMDTGKTGREPASFLKYRGRQRIDILVVSHAHPDHTGGLEYLTDRFHVREIWDNGRLILPDGLSHIPHRSLNRGDVIEGSGYRISVLHPYPEFYSAGGREYDAANNDSLVFRIESGGRSFLFTGDVEKEAEDDILHLGKWLKSDVLKTPHHGGKTSADEGFFRAVSPDIAVISVGRDNSFGHPHQETLDALEGAAIYRTDIDGAIKIKASENSLEIKTYKDFMIEKAGSFTDEINNFRKLCKTW